MLRTAGLEIVNFDPSAPTDKDSQGDGSLIFGLGLPGLIAIGMFVAVIVIVVRHAQF